MNPSSDTGWFLVADAKFRPLAEVAQETLSRHSVYPVVIHAVPGAFRWIDKPLSLLETPFKYTCYVDSDMLFGPTCDRVFNYRRYCTALPLFHLHSQLGLLYDEHHNARIARLQVGTGSQMPLPYCQSHVILYSQAAFPFLRRWIKIMEANPGHPECTDEEAMNVAIRERSPFGILPRLVANQGDCGCNPVLHGCKRPEKARAIVARVWPDLGISSRELNERRRRIQAEFERSMQEAH